MSASDQKTAEPANVIPSSTGVELTPLSILVVEDHVEAAESWDMLLELWGYPRRIATTGNDALAFCRQELPDVVMLDLRLPDVNGWEVATAIRQQYVTKRPLLIVVSAHGEEEDLRVSDEVGIDLHLVKPINPQDLASVLRRFARLLGRPDPSPT